MSTTQKCNTISFSTVSKTLAKTELKRKSPVKRKFVESKTSTFELSPSKINKSVNTDHAYISKETPDAKIKKLTKKIDALHQKVWGWEKQIKNMKDLLDTLKQKQLIANEQHVILNHNFGLGGRLGILFIRCSAKPHWGWNTVSCGHTDTQKNKQTNKQIMQMQITT